MARDPGGNLHHGEFDVRRLQVAPAFDLGLVALFRKTLEIFRGPLFGGLRSLVNFSRTKGYLGTTAPQRQKSLTRVTNETARASGCAGRTRWGGMVRGLRLRIWKPPAVVPPASTYVPTPSQINWVTGWRLHALHSIRVAGVVNGWLTPIWQKLWTVASEPRPCHHASAAASSQSRQKFLNRPGAMSV